jgi:hypothetical protein
MEMGTPFTKAAFFSEDCFSCAMAGRKTRIKAKTAANCQSLFVFVYFMVVNPFKVEVKKKDYIESIPLFLKFYTV